MSAKEQLLEKVSEFLSKVPGLKAREYPEFCALELRQNLRQSPAEWPKWADLPGVYYVLGEDGSVLYIGVGTAWYGVVWRVEQRIKRGHLPADTRAGAILFDESDWYWAFSLEQFLIDAMEPPLNIQGKRSSPPPDFQPLGGDSPTRGIRTEGRTRGVTKEGEIMARNNMEELERIVTKFLSKVSLDCQPDRNKFSLAEFCNVRGETWQRYAGWAGVYYLYSDDGIVHYVGQGGLRYGLGWRVVANATRCKLIEKPAMNVGLITFGESDLPFALALERFLIRHLSPSFNIQGTPEAGSR